MSATAYPTPADAKHKAALSRRNQSSVYCPNPSGTGTIPVFLINIFPSSTAEGIALSVQRKLLTFADLEQDWDSYGSYPVSFKAVAKASALFDKVINNFFKAKGGSVYPFDIAPLKNGGVQLEWRGPNGSLEVEIGPDEGFNYLLIQGQGKTRSFDEKDNVTASDILELISRIIG